jgi:hypothetical protein
MPSTEGFRGLRVYQLAFRLAMEIFEESKAFPKEEKYSLTDQIRRWLMRTEKRPRHKFGSTLRKPAAIYRRNVKPY